MKQPLRSDLRQKILDVIAAHGEFGAAAKIGVSRTALLRAISGLAVLPGTAMVIENSLREQTA
jgi:hypothetical protein